MSTPIVYSHCTGPGLGIDLEQDQDQWVLIYYAEEFTLVRDRDQYSLFTVMPVLFPVLHAR